MWLLEASIKRAIESAEAQGFTPTAEQTAQFNASLTAGPVDTSRVMTTAGDKAQIEVTGVMTKQPNIMARIFGGGNTTYAEIDAAIMAVESDPEIAETRMVIESPGGHIDGLFKTLAVMQAAKKPIHVVASKAASAAFAMAAQGDTITAEGPASQFGSIGVVAGFKVSEDVVEITSSKAPKKRPDVTTEEGVAMVREELDAVHDLFVDAIAEGRGTSADNVNAKFGEGSTLLANEALKRGMIDSIGSSNTKTATAQTGGKPQEARSMDQATLKAQHPDVYAAVKAEGQNEERDRVGAHLTMGEASGDMTTAISAVQDGSAMTATLQAKYMAAGMNRKDVQARQDDDADANAGDDANAGKDEAEANAGINILAAAAESCGVELEA